MTAQAYSTFAEGMAWGESTVKREKQVLGDEAYFLIEGNPSVITRKKDYWRIYILYKLNENGLEVFERSLGSFNFSDLAALSTDDDLRHCLCVCLSGFIHLNVIFGH